MDIGILGVIGALVIGLGIGARRHLADHETPS